MGAVQARFISSCERHLSMSHDTASPARRNNATIRQPPPVPLLSQRWIETERGPFLRQRQHFGALLPMVCAPAAIAACSCCCLRSRCCHVLEPAGAQPTPRCPSCRHGWPQSAPLQGNWGFPPYLNATQPCETGRCNITADWSMELSEAIRTVRLQVAAWEASGACCTCRNQLGGRCSSRHFFPPATRW